MNNTAILVDGGFYRKIAQSRNDFDTSTPEKAANTLISYCMRHLKEKRSGRPFIHDLYRIFYYDCLPSEKKVFHPLLDKTVDLRKEPMYRWMMEFVNELKKKRKVAIRLGKISDNNLEYHLKYEPTKKLCKGTIDISKLSQNDFTLKIEQKGVDMKIGLDIASLAYKKQVSQIVLISGDSDFVPQQN